MQEEVIKRCPFCGSDAEFEYNDFNQETGEGDDGTGWIKCTNSRCGVGFYDERDTCIKKWKNRYKRGLG